MPHATEDDDWKFQEDQDEAAIQALLNHGPQDAAPDFMSRDLEIGEKADDAQDFEDIDDDDLAEDEDEILRGRLQQANGHFDANEADEEDGGDADLDDLFGDGDEAPAVQEPEDGPEPDLDDLFGGQPSSPAPEASGLATPDISQLPESHSFEDTQALDDAIEVAETQVNDTIEDVENEDPEFQAQWLEQQQLFAAAKRDRDAFTHPFDVQPRDEDDEAAFKMIFPLFEKDKPLRWRKLLHQKRGTWAGRQPLKPPKSIVPTKVNLDILQDQEKSFRLPGPSVAGSKHHRDEEAAQKGLVITESLLSAEQESEDDLELDVLENHELVGCYTWQDLAIVCADWDVSSNEDITEEGDIEIRQPKRQKRFHDGSTLHRFYDEFPSLDDPEAATARIAKKVTLDMNDSNLMLELLDPDNLPKQPRKAGLEFKRDVGGSFTRALSKRFNISNDEAYDALKENHAQNKVRNLIGNESLEHAVPALRLQYPFYKVKLDARECRSFHRPSLTFKQNELARVSKNRRQKRKNLKGKPVKEIFATAADLSLADNSDMLLLEYSEEQPIMLSNFGMHTRLINYHRRKDEADTTRPKLPLGETSVLLPKDQGPFSIFGSVNPGETVPTITNQMFRAPVFQHEPKKSDFLVVRSSTGENGNSWHLRSIENLMVVGQQFPSMEVPGIHSRKVTEAAKNRLKMIAYRIYRSNSRKNTRGPKLSNEMIKEHLPGTDIAQNRGKLREFMAYDKERGSWNPNPADYSDDAPVEALRKILPETICLIDATQVGSQYLRDSGYSKDEPEDRDEQANAKDEDSVEQQMAPWSLTKNFLNACQGKAMLELHGAGDPSSRGEAFSFVKTSMKGGFRAVGESVEDKLDAKRIKENGGHSYNVAKQQQKYEESIRKIWEAQKMSLGSTEEPEDAENDVDNVQDAGGAHGRDFTPSRPGGSIFSARTPGHRDDESASQFSRLSRNSDSGKVLRITRRVPDANGQLVEQIEIVRDARVIREYQKRRSAERIENMKLNIKDLAFTGDAHSDELKKKALESELARLERNQERRIGREKAKGIYNPPAGDGSAGTTTSKTGGTTRKCKRCGQAGHISTNKKLCPMQNGTIKGPEEAETAFPQPTI